MPRDNEKIIEILDEVEQLLKGRFKELIDCGASYPVLERFMDALRAVNSASLSMGDGETLEMCDNPLTLTHRALIGRTQRSAGYVVRMNAGSMEEAIANQEQCEITPPSH